MIFSVNSENVLNCLFFISILIFLFIYLAIYFGGGGLVLPCRIPEEIDLLRETRGVQDIMFCCLLNICVWSVMYWLNSVYRQMPKWKRNWLLWLLSMVRHIKVWLNLYRIRLTDELHSLKHRKVFEMLSLFAS